MCTQKSKSLLQKFVHRRFFFTLIKKTKENLKGLYRPHASDPSMFDWLTAQTTVGSQTGFRVYQGKQLMEILTKSFITQNTKFNLHFNKMSFQSFIVHVTVMHRWFARSTQTNLDFMCASVEIIKRTAGHRIHVWTVSWL